MILVDTSIWIDHFRVEDDRLSALLESRSVLMHPCVLGELALGGLHDRVGVLTDLAKLPPTLEASHEEIRRLIEAAVLYGRGIGYVDAQLLASVLLTPGAGLWTRDRRLQEAARALDVAAVLDH